MSQHNLLKDKRILMFQQRGWGTRIGHFLAKKLQAEGCHLAALTLKKSAHQFLKEQKEVNYDLIINHDEIVVDPEKYLSGEKYSLSEICHNLNIDSIWPLVMTLRFHVRSYKDKFYYGFKQNVPDDEIIIYIKAVYKLIKTTFDKFNPDVILAPNIADLLHTMFNLYAQKRGVGMITVVSAKVRDQCVFIHDYNYASGSFYDRIEELHSGKDDSSNRDKARQYIKEFRESFKRPETEDRLYKTKTLWQKIRHQISPYYHILRWYYKKPMNYLPNIGPTIDYKPPRIILRDHYSRLRYKRFTDKFSYYPFSKLKKIIYFPLQFQPELTIDTLSPYFSNQIETARQVAMSLPDDYTLVVKEHPAMVGLRPSSYIEKVARTPNVRLIDYRIPSDKILRQADLIISSSGTSIAEAAFYNKPVIQLGNLGITLLLPNTFKHTNMTTLSKKIKEVLAINLHTPEYEEQLENYIAAAYDSGFEFNYWGVWERCEKEDMDILWQAWKKEIQRAIR